MSTLQQQLETLTGKQVKAFEEWQHVYFVKFTSGRPTFVSKKKVVMELNLNVLSPVKWKLEASTRRQEYKKKWVARITGQDAKFTFARQFINASSIEWGKYGMKKAVFQIDAPGYYQDSDGDYFKVWATATGFDAETCSYQEVKHHFYTAQLQTVNA